MSRTEDGLRTIDESIYDHPKYYDLVFNTDVAAETAFILQCSEIYATKSRGKPADLFFEPACGTGRLMHSLMRRGYLTCGLDLNPKAVEFCNARLHRNGYESTAVVADMCDFGRKDFRGAFQWPKRKPLIADVAFNTINSFRHVESEARAVAHLRCVADMIRPGGIYLLGLHLTPSKVEPSDGESWSARRGHLAINTHMWTISREKRKRLERFGIRFDIHTPSDSFRINDELRLRSYTPAQMNRLIDSSGCWEVAATYDFGYDIEQPIDVDGSSEDVVYVLKRRRD